MSATIYYDPSDNRYKKKLIDIKSFKLFAIKPGAGDVSTVISVELGEFGPNQLRIEGDDETKVLGISGKLQTLLKQHESYISTVYKKFGLGINSIIFFFALIIIPSINSITRRAIFVLSVSIVLYFLLLLHRKTTPILTIDSKDRYTKIKILWRNISPVVYILTGVIATAIIDKFLGIKK